VTQTFLLVDITKDACVAHCGHGRAAAVLKPVWLSVSEILVGQPLLKLIDVIKQAIEGDQRIVLSR
jgi:hypothetical protein